MMKKFLGILLTLSILLPLNGCGGKSSYRSFLREGVDLSYITSVAVLPFENHTNDSHVHKRCRDITITQILSMGVFDTSDRGIVDNMLKEEAIEPTEPLDKSSIKRLGQRLNVQALLFGSIGLAREQRKSDNTFPELTLTLRLIDTSSGMILWQASGTRNSDTLMTRLFGFSPDDDFKLTSKLVKQLLSTLAS